MKLKKDNTLTQQEMIERGCKRLSAEELQAVSENKTMWGDYYYNHQWRIYVCYSYSDGTIEGTNDLGSLNKGKWKVHANGVYSIRWSGSWEDWDGVAYEVGDTIMFFDTTTDMWRTTFTKVIEGKHALAL